MQTVKEFGGSTATMSLREFWRTAGPAVAAILVLALVMVLWKRLISKPLRRQIKWALLMPFYELKYYTMGRRRKVSDLEMPDLE